MPTETKEKLKNLASLTHAAFQQGAWEEGAYWTTREAHILTLSQVLMLDPRTCTMQEAYVFYNQQRKICKKKVHSPKAGNGVGE